MNEEDVAGWLRDHPGFLAGRPDLYRLLAPPRRVHGEELADHMAAMITAERAATRHLTEAAREGDGFAARIQAAILALIASRDPAETVAQEWPALLGLEHCALASEGPPAAHRLSLPAGSVSRLMPAGREALIRLEPTELLLLHAEAAALVLRDALALVPLPGPPTLLVLGARDKAALPSRGAAAQLQFLAAALAAALSRIEGKPR
ncbi:DUF484 family protein [Teichococcus oryzae]|uniref:DUF484 family protein n=1 Tax=Teichococcus oryzae TaxID=1608942 RepID=A0A5B2TK67_9PROT|nr:DUF484 family protein [Pseudoroseomonas oryzae]KAA2214579.1 DUF484 family protein [Pseudoroseomonas oryzae]